MLLPPDMLDDLNELTRKIGALIEESVTDGSPSSISAVAVFKCLFALSIAKGVSKKSFLEICDQSWDLCEALLRAKSEKGGES